MRKDYGSHFTWAYGETPVEFNKRHTTEQVQFPWRRAVDGLYLDYDRLFGAGIDVREGAHGEYRLAQNEKVQLLNCSMSRWKASNPALWDTIGDLIDQFSPAECTNFFRAAGYVIN